MDEKRVFLIWARFRTKGVTLLKGLLLYLDDLLLIGGGVCFVYAAWDWQGRAAALAVAGVWLCLLAVVVARSRRGGAR